MAVMQLKLDPVTPLEVLCGEKTLRIAEELGALLGEEEHGIAELLGQVEIVGDDDLLGGLVQCGKGLVELPGPSGVKVGGGFVEDDDPALLYKGLGDQQKLLLTGTELADLLSGVEVDLSQQRFDQASVFAAVVAVGLFVGVASHQDKLVDADKRVETGEFRRDVGDALCPLLSAVGCERFLVYEDLALEADQAAKRFGQRAFTDPVRPEDAEMRLDAEVGIADDGPVVAAGELLDFDHCISLQIVLMASPTRWLGMRM